jgi:hypothetical protein
VRKSLESLKHTINYTKQYSNLPIELKPFYVYLADTGHSIMGIAKMLLDSTQFSGAELWELEAAIPVKYVLTHSFTLYHGHIVIDVPYDKNFGIDVDDKYFEY